MNGFRNHFHLGEDKKEDFRSQYGDAIVFTDTCDNP